MRDADGSPVENWRCEQSGTRIPNGYVYHYVGEIPKYEPWQELAFSDKPIPVVNTEEELSGTEGGCFIPKWLKEKLKLRNGRISMFKHNRKPE